jgi:anti-anti-sigma factor
VSLGLEIAKFGEVTIVHCRGRIVFREEALALTETVSQLLPDCRQIILDLQGVTAVDSAGLGELVSLHMWALGSECSIKLCGLSSRLSHLLAITNLTSVFDVYPTEEEATEACARADWAS